MIRSILTLPFRIVGFAVWFALEIVRSSWAVIVDVVTPGSQATPRIVRMPLPGASDAHTTGIAMLITLTPGTLTLGAQGREPAERAILVHSLYHDSEEATLADLRDMERRMTAAVRVRKERS